MKKRLVFIFIVAALLLFSLSNFSRCSCNAELPNAQTYTKWASEDGSMVFYIDGDHQSFGTILSNGEKINVVLYWLDGVSLEIKPITVYDGESFVFYWDSVPPPASSSEIEVWTYRYNPSKRKNNKIVIMCDETTRFAIEQKLVLWRVGENLSSEEIEYPPIQLPEYYYIYKKYEDLLDWKLKAKEDIIEKYGDFDICDDKNRYYYYIAETDDMGYPKYLIRIYIPSSEAVWAELKTP